MTGLLGFGGARGDVEETASPLELPFLGFLLLDLGESMFGGLLLEDLASEGPPFGDMFSNLGSFRVSFCSLKATLTGAFSSFAGLFSGGFREEEDSLTGLLRSLSLLLLSESFLIRSLCSFVTLWGFEALLPSLLLSFEGCDDGFAFFGSEKADRGIVGNMG